MTSPFVIAVDGPAASGKGTIASRLAAHYGLPFHDTRLLYRAVGLDVLTGGGDLSDARAAERAARALDAARLSEDPALTTGEAGEAASRVAGHPGVRAALLDLQQAFARQAGGAVLDGRDIGTVIAPDAAAKLFVTATPETRAHRRWLQLSGRGDAITFDDMLADIQRRDEVLLSAFIKNRIPVAVLYGGGYNRQPEFTAKLHRNTIATAKKLASEFRGL